MAPGPLTLTWYAADLRTGAVLEELRSLTPSGTFGRKLGVSTSATFDLAIGGAPSAWISSTQPGRSMLVAVDDQTGNPIWAGLTFTRARGSAPAAQIGCATPEAYLDRRYTGTYVPGVPVDQAVLMTNLGQALAVNAPPFVFDAPNTGSTVSYDVVDSDDRTILSTYQELMGMEGGAEWTCDVAWADAAHTKFTLPIRIRPTIGAQSANPEAVFDLPGCISDYAQTESYEAGKGATDILAYGDGQGTARLHSSVYSATALLASGWPSWAYRFTPATGITDPVQLNAHAAAALAQMSAGTSAWSVDAVASQAPRVGLDFSLGDAVHVLVTQSLGHPSGADVVARCYAWDLDLAANKITPTLVEG